MASIIWWPLLGAIFLIGMIFKIYPLAGFALMLLLISGLAMWWNQRSLKEVKYSRQLIYKRGFPEETLQLTVELANRKFLPVPWMRVQDPIPMAICPSDPNAYSLTHLPDQGLLVTLFSLRWFERDRRVYNLLLRQRGVFRLGPAQLESGDILGLFQKNVEDQRLDTIIVFPEPLPIRSLMFPADDPFGDQQARRRLYEDPNLPMGVRDYLPEDDFRRIHWPATAHTGAMQVKVYQPVASKVMVVCLNVSTLPHYWEGTRPDLLEHLVGVCAGLVQQGLADGYKVGLISNGSLAHADQPFRVPPGRSPKQLTQLLAVLAGVTPFTSAPFERFLIREVPRLPYGASLLIVTALLPPVLVETMVRLKHSNRRVTLLSIAKSEPPVIPGVRVLHKPYLD